MKKTVGLKKDSGVARLTLVRMLAITLVLLCFSIFPQIVSADDSSAVINYRTWNCKINGLKFTMNFRTSITVFNKRGDEQGNIFIYENGHSKIKQIRLRVKNAAGEILLERKKDDFTRRCGYGRNEIYNDNCYYDISVSAPSYPYTIEYEYVQDCKTLFFWRGATLQLDIPVTQASYELDVTEGFQFNYKVYDLEIEPTITNIGKRTTYVWELYDLPALEDIDYTPHGVNEPGRIRFASHRFDFEGSGINECNWMTIGNWFFELASDKYNLQTNRLQIKDSATALSILEKTYKKVVEQTRYVAVEIGIGGWEPYAASLTESRGYGDCKDMSTLLLSNFLSHGMEAYPALIMTKSGGKTDPDFPEFSFNHVISVAVVGTDTIWMDPTCDNCPFGELAYGIQDVNALVVRENKSSLWRTSSNSASKNITSRVTNWSLGADLYADFTCTMSVTGSYALFLRNRLPTFTKDEEKTFVDRQFQGANKTYKISDYQLLNLDNLELPVEIIVNGRTTKKLRMIGDVLYFRPTVLCDLNDLEKTDLEERKYPLNLFYPEIIEDIFVVTWDSSLAIDSIVLPESMDLKIESCRFQFQSSKDSLGVTIQTSRVYNSFELPVEQFESFSTYRKKMKKKLGRSVKLVREL